MNQGNVHKKLIFLFIVLGVVSPSAILSRRKKAKRVNKDARGSATERIGSTVVVVVAMVFDNESGRRLRLHHCTNHGNAHVHDQSRDHFHDHFPDHGHGHFRGHAHDRGHDRALGSFDSVVDTVVQLLHDRRNIDRNNGKSHAEGNNGREVTLKRQNHRLTIESR